MYTGMSVQDEGFGFRKHWMARQRHSATTLLTFVAFEAAFPSHGFDHGGWSSLHATAIGG